MNSIHRGSFAQRDGQDLKGRAIPLPDERLGLLRTPQLHGISARGPRVDIRVTRRNASCSGGDKLKPNHYSDSGFLFHLCREPMPQAYLHHASANHGEPIPAAFITDTAWFITIDKIRYTDNK